MPDVIVTAMPSPLDVPRHGTAKKYATIALSLTCAAAASVLMTVLGSGPARAAEIRLLSAAAMQSVFKEIAGDFERTSGHKLIIAYGTIGGITQRVLSGETADVIIGSTLAMPALVKAGKIDGDSQTTLCTTGIGVVTPAGSAAPRIQSIADLERSLLEAKVVVYADPVRGGAAGVHVAKVLQRLAIADRLKSQITLAAGGDITEVTLAQGTGAVGITQVSEIVGKPGTQFLGPLPEEVQNYTVFVAAIPAGVKRSEAVAAFLAFLKGPTVAAAIKAKGMQPD